MRPRRVRQRHRDESVPPASQLRCSAPTSHTHTHTHQTHVVTWECLITGPNMTKPRSSLQRAKGDWYCWVLPKVRHGQRRGALVDHKPGDQLRGRSRGDSAAWGRVAILLHLWGWHLLVGRPLPGAPCPSSLGRSR